MRLQETNIRINEAQGPALADRQSFVNAMIKHGATKQNLTRFNNFIDANDGYFLGNTCSILHPASSSCIKHNFWLFYISFIEMFPIYLSLNSVPRLVLKTKSLLKEYALINKASETCSKHFEINYTICPVFSYIRNNLSSGFMHIFVHISTKQDKGIYILDRYPRWLLGFD